MEAYHKEPQGRKKREAIKRKLEKTHVYSSKHARQVEIKKSMKKRK